MSIIRQSVPLAVIPDFRNISIPLKIWLSANTLMIGIAVFVSNGQSLLFFNELSHLIQRFEPGLLISLIVLTIFSKPLHNKPYAVYISLIITLCIFLILNQIIQNDIHPLALGAIITIAMFATLHYFSLIERSRAPAIAEARLIALTSRIRPHFLFNSLNAAIALVRDKPEKTEMILENLADLFRAQLAEPGKASTLERELELARMYQTIEQERLGKRLKVQWTIKAPGDAVLPPLLLQPLLENAVYHGIERMINPAPITISVSLIQRRISIAVLNPFDPDQASPHQGNKVALANLTERLALIFDDDATLQVNQGSDSFLIRIELPYRSSHKFNTQAE